ncbi:ATP-binding protein [Streptomyces phyllanthi]|uniref:ATP-binding protein n=1 Tax=Streptomyces phyllanthi TaxID=1803180 RepID=A0A5N8WGI0_9ACTN|nr:ATP-binding protein [Streptomyces phyllanthi]MPY45564.1 ATP-binding protein [Streptomyces phyllanthi]
MKQVAAKTLGVAALGAAIAAAGAGAASAATALPAAPDASKTLGTVTKSLPTENVSKTLPGAGEVATQGQSALGTGVAAAQPTADKVIPDGKSAPTTKLLGGLRPGGLGKGAGVNTLPLGGATGV